MAKYIASIIFLIVISLTTSAEELFIGKLLNTKGKPLKGVRVYVQNQKEAVKSDKKGEFKIANINSLDSIHISYKDKIHVIAVDGRTDMQLIIGEDNRIFEKSDYTGETFHGHLIDYKGKPIRGAIVYTNDPFDYVKSDADGNFLIDNIEPTDTIHIKYDSYVHDIAMDGSKGMYIKILRGAGRRTNSESINTGAGAIDSHYYNGPRTVKTAKELEATGHSDLLLAVSQMPGVSYVWPQKSDDKPNVSIRHSQWPPLWIIDGVEMTECPDFLTVIEVEKVEILPDGAGFGTRGAGGVILITTKGSNL